MVIILDNHDCVPMWHLVYHLIFRKRAQQVKAWLGCSLMMTLSVDGLTGSQSLLQLMTLNPCFHIVKFFLQRVRVLAFIEEIAQHDPSPEISQ